MAHVCVLNHLHDRPRPQDNMMQPALGCVASMVPLRRFTASSLGRYMTAPLTATRLFVLRPAQVARAAAVLSFGTAAVTAHCVSGARPHEDLAKKLQEIEQMKLAILEREREASQQREHAREQREDEGDSEGEFDFEDEGDGEDDGDDQQSSHPVDEPFQLQVGGACVHSLLGKGTLLAIGATEAVSNGVLADGQTFASLNVRPDQVLFSFEKREKCGKTSRSWRTVTKTRAVFASAVIMSPADISGDEDVATTAFDSMTAATLEENAFTLGMTPPQLAAHERKRKAAKLRSTAGIRGRNSQGRKTPEPKLAASVRVAEYPNENLIVSPSGATGLFCNCCHIDISKRMTSIKSHVNGRDHKSKCVTIVYRSGPALCSVHTQRSTDPHPPVRRLAKWLASQAQDVSISDLITAHFKENPDVQMATVPNDTHLFRWRVMESMMFAGIPSGKINMLRPVLEREGHPLTDSSHMSQLYIPLIEKREIEHIAKEHFEQHFTLIFDGTTRLGEAVNMVTRTITDNFDIRMRLVAFKTTLVHMNGDGLFRLIATTLQRILGIDLDYCVSYARDSCSTNYDAVNRLLSLSVNALNMLCFPHTLHNTGKHLKLPVLEEFSAAWLQLVPKPGAARLRWAAILGHSVSSYSTVRWWSRWDIYQEIALNFGAVPQFLADLDRDSIGDATTKKMLAVINNKRKELELELAAVLSCERLYNATYRLEGDRLELLLVYRTIEELREFGRTLGQDSSNLPSVAALLRNETIDLNTETREWFPAPHNKWFQGKVTRLPITTGAAARRKATFQVTYSEDGTSIEQDEQELRNNICVLKMSEWQSAVDMVKGAYDYLEQRITDDCNVPYHCSGPYEVCRVSQLLDPSFAAVHLIPSFVDELCAAIPAISGCSAALKMELDAYKLAARNAPALDHNDVELYTKGVLAFWRKEGTKIPAWRKVAKIVFTITPNSASSERVFSLLEAMFGKDQDLSLSDRIQGSLMLRYNKRSVG